MLALAAADVWLVGAFHGGALSSARLRAAPCGRAGASIDEGLAQPSFPQAARAAASRESAAHAVGALPPRRLPDRTRPQLWRVVWTSEKSLQIAAFFCACGSASDALSRPSRRCYARPPRDPSRGASDRVEHTTEPTAERLWDDVSRPAPRGTQRDDLRDLVRRRGARASSATTRSRSSSRTTSRASGSRGTSSASSRPRRATRSAATSASRSPCARPARRPGDGADRAARRRAAPAERAGAAAGEPEVHVRPLRDRLVEPLRPRGRARRRRGAGPGVQPALHLRRHRARQDAPAAGDRRST